MFLEKYPYLNPNLNNENIILICETNMNKKSNIMKYIQHEFKDEIQICVFNFNH